MKNRLASNKWKLHLQRTKMAMHSKILFIENENTLAVCTRQEGDVSNPKKRHHPDSPDSEEMEPELSELERNNS